ncbi:MAG: hypothetical protein ACK4PI_13300 [Tepidisphaerales bacterium]
MSSGVKGQSPGGGSAEALSGMPTRGQVQAATEAALRGLRAQVEALPLGEDLTVGAFLKSFRDGPDFMNRTLQRAQMVGGARVIDSETVQVRLDISGRVVADAIMQLAGAYQRQTGRSPQAIAEATRAWSDRTLTATGLSTGVVSSAGVVAPARPLRTRAESVGPEGGAETAASGVLVDGGVVAPEALEAAQRAAAESALAALSAATLPDGRSGRELTRLVRVRDAVTLHVMARTPRERQRLSDGSVRVTVPLDGARLVEVVRSAVLASNEPWVPTDEASWRAWSGVLQGVVPSEVEGVWSSASKDAARVVVALEPPAWADGVLDAEGTAAAAGSKLQTARQAESAALRSLRSVVERLPLSPEVTLGEAARRSPMYATVLERAMSRARVTRVEYFEDGSASVRVATDGRVLWQDVLSTNALLQRPGGRGDGAPGR